jgi:hypothetical protein
MLSCMLAATDGMMVQAPPSLTMLVHVMADKVHLLLHRLRQHGMVLHLCWVHSLKTCLLSSWPACLKGINHINSRQALAEGKSLVNHSKEGGGGGRGEVGRRSRSQQVGQAPLLNPLKNLQSRPSSTAACPSLTCASCSSLRSCSGR